jgi:hypothetical protein
MKKIVKKGQFGLLAKAAGKAVEKYSAKNAVKETAKAAAKTAEADGWKQMRKLQRFEEGRIKTPLSKKDKETATNYRNSPAGKKWNDDQKKFWDGWKESMRNHGATITDKPVQKNGGKTAMAKNGKQMLKRADGSTSQRGLWDNIRAAKGSGKKPTAAMLKQEKKIKAKTKK